MQNVVRLIVSNYANGRVYGERIVDNAGFETVESATEEAKKYIAKGRSVIVRPAYNERDALGVKYYREWRSFDGGTLEMVRWDCINQDD